MARMAAKRRGWLSGNRLQYLGYARFAFRPGGRIERTRGSYAIIKRSNSNGFLRLVTAHAFLIPGDVASPRNTSTARLRRRISSSSRRPICAPTLDFGTVSYLIHHEVAWGAQSIPLIRLDRKTERRCVRVVGRERADGDGFSPVETVILKNDDGPRLARIVLAARDGPDVAASHSWPAASSMDVDIASMNA